MEITQTEIRNILTRTTGYLRTVTSHSLQPYRGCTFGKALCGVGCYVQHNGHVVRGRHWGQFLEVRTNAAESYLANAPRERRWAHTRQMPFSIFCSSATDPFLPQEERFGITSAVLLAMAQSPPDELVVQTHSDGIIRHLDSLKRLAACSKIRIHVSIETDRESIPGLPPHACSVANRLAACRALKLAGLFTVITVSPLLPIADPKQFFASAADSANAVVIDHYIEGDGSPDGARTRRTRLPQAIRQVDPRADSLKYRDEIVAIARRYFPKTTGVSINGFAGRYERASLTNSAGEIESSAVDSTGFHRYPSPD